jgi:hypothetical protein
MGATRFGGGYSRCQSPVEEITICKTITLENALLSRKLATTKYLHAYNLGRSHSKSSERTEVNINEPECTPNLLERMHQPFD